MTERTQRIIVGLSGGVDSAVSAWLLREQGHRVEGLFMKNWEDDDVGGHCTAEADRASARRVCEQLGIPLHHVNFASRYRREVFEQCLGEFRAGRTPNPDILCNRHIKFRAFLDHARRLGADAVATGHYAGLTGDPGQRRLLRATDAGKDQTYFLYALDQEQLADVRFPLAGLHKSEVRELAAEAGFDNFDRADSTGICFIGERDFRGFLARYIEPEPGPIETPEGRHLGEHMGLAFYTIGQRRGLDLGGRAGQGHGAWYVAGKDIRRNRLIVVQGHDHSALLSSGLQARRVHWIAGAPPRLPFECTARTRYRQVDQPCRVEADGPGLRVIFETLQRAIAPGQHLVLYQGDTCLGGGVIENPLATAGTPREACASA